MFGFTKVQILNYIFSCGLPALDSWPAHLPCNQCCSLCGYLFGFSAPPKKLADEMQVLR
jgi:hypothetical protein